MYKITKEKTKKILDFTQLYDEYLDDLDEKYRVQVESIVNTETSKSKIKLKVQSAKKMIESEKLEFKYENEDSSKEFDAFISYYEDRCVGRKTIFVLSTIILILNIILLQYISTNIIGSMIGYTVSFILLCASMYGWTNSIIACSNLRKFNKYITELDEENKNK